MELNNIHLLHPTGNVIYVPGRYGSGRIRSQEHPLAQWARVLASATALRKPGSFTFQITEDQRVKQRFMRCTVSWQLLDAVNRICDKWEMTSRHKVNRYERTRLWNGIHNKLSRWIRDNDAWRRQLYYSWGAKALNGSFTMCIGTLAELIRASCTAYMQHGNIRLPRGTILQ